MNNLSKYSKIVFCFICISLVCAASSASANPDKLKLSFIYKANGTLAVDVKFNSPATSRCTARHRVSIYHEGDVLGQEGVIRSSVFNRVVPIGRESTSLRAFRLLGVKQKNGKDPILAIQTRLVCPNEPNIDSNVEARYVRCGEKTARLSTSKYLSTLRKELE